MSSRIRLSETPPSPTSIATVWGEELDVPKDAIPKVAPVEKRQAFLTAKDQTLLQQEFLEKQAAKATALGTSYTSPVYGAKGGKPKEQQSVTHKSQINTYE
jgi:hypothetical protein